jgi:hypothetical protein
MNKRNYIFESCVTINGEFLIFQDDVFSIKEQKSIGNIWSSVDLFKKIFKSVNIKNNEYKIIRESILRLPLLENNGNLYGLRDILLEFDFLQDTWLGRNLVKDAKGVKDFVSNSYEGIKKFGLAISQGQWSEVINLLGKGVVFILRSVKDALYSTTGSIIDAILVAMTGQVVPFVAWTLVFGLDVYQFINNDYQEETSEIMKVLNICFAVLGMVGTGFLAKRVKNLFSPIQKLGNNEKAIAKVISETPQMKSTLSMILDNLQKVPSVLNRVIGLLSKSFQKGSTFLQSIKSGLSTVFSKIKSLLSRLLSFGKKATTIGAKDAGLNYGLQKGIEKGIDVYDKFSKPKNVEFSYENLNDIQKNNMKTLTDVLKNENL